MWDPHTHRRQFLDVVEIDEQLFERPLVAIDFLGYLGESAVTAIDVVDLAGAIEPDTRLEHRRRNGVSLDGESSGDGAIVWSSLARKILSASHMHAHALTRRNTWNGTQSLDWNA